MRPRVPRPLEDSYWSTVAIVIAVLSPHIVVTTAWFLLIPQLVHDLHASTTSLAVTEGLANAGYAFGALVGGDIVQRLPQRRLFLAATALLFAGFVLGASSTSLVPFASGRVLQGLATGLLLVIAVPPLVQRFPAERMPSTAAMINIGFFGAVAVGPLLAGGVASTHGWRLFLGALAAVVLAGFALALLALPSTEPPNPGLRFDAPAIALGLAGTVLAFLAVSLLGSLGFGSPLFAGLLAAGVLAILALLVLEYRRGDDALSPVGPLSSTVPSIGTLAACVGGGAFVSFVALVELLLTRTQHATPLRTGLDFWPQVLGVLLAALALGALTRTGYLPHLTLSGMLFLIAGGALLAAAGGSTSRVTVLAITGCLGFGAGATVSPGLWIAGFSLPAALVGRTFALVELVRSEADFVEAPIVRKLAASYDLHVAVWAALAVAVAGTIVGVALWWAGGATAQEPGLEQWLSGESHGYDSPPHLSRLSSG